jgi:hypothetical protein
VSEIWNMELWGRREKETTKEIALMLSIGSAFMVHGLVQNRV